MCIENTKWVQKIMWFSILNDLKNEKDTQFTMIYYKEKHDYPNIWKREPVKTFLLGKWNN